MLEQSPGNFGNARVPYDWYQNSTHVIITIRIANLKENDVKVTIINDALDVMCQLLDGRQFRMHFNLHRTVVVPDSNWAVDTSKLVINLRKSDRKRWHSLETYPDKSAAAQQAKPKSFVGIVNLRDAKNELNSLLSATEFENIENNNTAITITQARNSTSSEPISLDYNWYQTDNYINLVIHVPNIKMADNRNFLFYEDDINIILTDNTLNWICNFPSGVTNVNFKLFREINSSESRYEISPCRTKIEIKLRKLDEKYWPSFVISDSAAATAAAAAADENGGDGGEQAPQPITKQAQQQQTAVAQQPEVAQEDQKPTTTTTTAAVAASATTTTITTISAMEQEEDNNTIIHTIIDDSDAQQSQQHPAQQSAQQQPAQQSQQSAQQSQQQPAQQSQQPAQQLATGIDDVVASSSHQPEATTIVPIVIDDDDGDDHHDDDDRKQTITQIVHNNTTTAPSINTLSTSSSTSSSSANLPLETHNQLQLTPNHCNDIVEA